MSALEESYSLTPSEIRLVTVADREGDLYEFLDRAQDLEAEYAEAVDWLLLTNVAISTWGEATERISWYGVRPGIESWHKVSSDDFSPIVDCTDDLCALVESVGNGHPCHVAAANLNNVDPLHGFLLLFAPVDRVSGAGAD